MKKIVIEFIEEKNHRPEMHTADWFFDGDDNLWIRVTDMKDWRFNLLCARHELDEAVLCKHEAITTNEVDLYCKLADSIPTNPDSFSGYPHSPHQAQHNDALAAEWIMSRLLGVDWKKYGEAFDKI